MYIGSVWSVYEASPMFCKDTTQKRKEAVKTIWTEFASAYWSKPIKSLTSDLIAEWLGKRCRLCSNKTYNEYLRIVRQVLNAVLSKTGLSCNPANEVPARRKNSISRQPISPERFAVIQEALEAGTITIPYNYRTHGRTVVVDRPYAIPHAREVKLTVLLGWWCGMRLGDAVRMTKTNFSDGFLEYTPAKTQATSGAVVQVPVLNDELIRAFENCDGHLTPNLLNMYLKRESDLCRLYERIFKACGCETSVECEGRRSASLCGFHSLRHSFVTNSCEAGVDIETVRSVVGHASVITTKIYDHISKKRKALELSKLLLKTQNAS